jgi:sterol 3beta-glucosyltransferase
MFSSIHTIHRPVARSKRAGVPTSFRSSTVSTPATVAEATDNSSPEEDEGLPSRDDDFEARIHGPERPQNTDKTEAEAVALVTERKGREKEAAQNAPTRSGSMGTVKLKRRAALADKLRDIFEVPGITEVVAGMLF